MTKFLHNHFWICLFEKAQQDLAVINRVDDNKKLGCDHKDFAAEA